MNHLIGTIITLAWASVGVMIYFGLESIPMPKGLDFSKTKISRLQCALFIAGFLAKFFAFGAYFVAGKWWAIGLCIAALVALFSVFTLGMIFRKIPTREERRQQLLEELKALEHPRTLQP